MFAEGIMYFARSLLSAIASLRQAQRTVPRRRTRKSFNHFGRVLLIVNVFMIRGWGMAVDYRHDVMPMAPAMAVRTVMMNFNTSFQLIVCFMFSIGV